MAGSFAGGRASYAGSYAGARGSFARSYAHSEGSSPRASSVVSGMTGFDSTGPDAFSEASAARYTQVQLLPRLGLLSRHTSPMPCGITWDSPYFKVRLCAC